jgi:hypothetical protein
VPPHEFVLERHPRESRLNKKATSENRQPRARTHVHFEQSANCGLCSFVQLLHTASTLHDVAHVRSSSPLAAPPPARHRSQLHGTLCLIKLMRARPPLAASAAWPWETYVAPVDKIYSEPQPANRLDVYMVSLKICIEGHVAPRPRACGGPRRGRAPQSDRGPRTPQRAAATAQDSRARSCVA